MRVKKQTNKELLKEIKLDRKHINIFRGIVVLCLIMTFITWVLSLFTSSFMLAMLSIIWILITMSYENSIISNKIILEIRQNKHEVN